MGRYAVIIRYDASQSIEVNASSPEMAAEEASDRIGVSICHECSRKVEIGEFIGLIVLGEGGEPLLKMNEFYDIIDERKENECNDG